MWCVPNKTTDFNAITIDVISTVSVNTAKFKKKRKRKK